MVGKGGWSAGSVPFGAVSEPGELCGAGCGLVSLSWVLCCDASPVGLYCAAHVRVQAHAMRAGRLVTKLILSPRRVTIVTLIRAIADGTDPLGVALDVP